MREQFSNHLKQIRKQQAGHSYDGLIEEIRKSFFRHLSFLPEDMRYDVFHYFLDRCTDARDVYNDFDNLSEKLLDVTDLFCSNYDDEAGCISNEELDVLKEMVNDFSTEVPEDVLFYVMKKAVERGSFHR
jgi:hypothetical protein